MTATYTDARLLRAELWVPPGTAAGGDRTRHPHGGRNAGTDLLHFMFDLGPIG